jgi:hypothetical protein
MPVTFGLDISHHQNIALDLHQCRREGIEFVFLKATEGSTFVDSEFGANLAEARAAGLLVCAYHYLRSTASAAAQVANVARVVPQDVPVIPDVEANSGSIGLTREFVTRLREAGYRVPLLYLPRWYWQQIGSPPLAGLPPLWSSRYPDNVIGALQSKWAQVPAHYWNGYGGLDVAVLQFTSSARIAGHAPLDANAYRGTRAQLAALLGGEEDTMTPQELLDYPIKRVGSALGGTTTLAAVLAHFDSALERETARDAALSAAVAALSNDPGLDKAAVAEIVDAAVKAHTPTAAQVAEASRPVLEDVIRDVVPDEQADTIIRRLAEKLGATEGN